MKDWFFGLLCSWDWRLWPRKAPWRLQLQVPVLSKALREAGEKNCWDSQDWVNVCGLFLLFLMCLGNDGWVPFFCYFIKTVIVFNTFWFVLWSLHWERWIELLCLFIVSASTYAVCVISEVITVNLGLPVYGTKPQGQRWAGPPPSIHTGACPIILLSAFTIWVSDGFSDYLIIGRTTNWRTIRIPTKVELNWLLPVGCIFDLEDHCRIYIQQS